MKNLFRSLLLAGAMFGAVQAYAQHTIKKVTVKVGHTTAHAASKGAAIVVDRRYRGKYGPHGEDIFIDKHSRYYYVDHRGHHVYVTRMHLRSRKY